MKAKQKYNKKERLTWYPKLINQLNRKCTKRVNNDMKRTIPLSSSDILRLLNVLRRWEKTEFYRYLPELKPFYKLLRHNKVNYNLEMVPLNPRLQWILLIGINEVGNDKLDFNLARLIERWYDVNRARVRVFKEFFPEDNRNCRNEDAYDGPEPFVLDNINLEDFEIQNIESGIKYNSWSKDKYARC